MMTVLDTFAGAGGFSLGFKMTNKFKSIGAIEIDKWASETYKYNNPDVDVLVEDICSISDDRIREVFANKKPNIILGGPPCQGFSIANKNAGDCKDPRNSLFKEFVRVGRILTPDIMIMENVPNLIKAKTENNELVIDIIRKELEDLGYIIKWDILNCTDFGVPQIRKRLFIIASKKELVNWFPFPTHVVVDSDQLMFNDGLQPCPTLWDAISDLPDINAREGEHEMVYTKESQTDYQKHMRMGSNMVFNHTSMKHSLRMVERFKSMSWGDSSSDVPDHLKPFKRNGKGEISDKTYDQNNRRMYPFKPCHTITASFYANFVHPYKDRNFTPREGARIQSFPDTYIFKGKPTVVSQKLLQREDRIDEKYLGQYNQIGNAVPPLLAKAIAENLFLELNRK